MADLATEAATALWIGGRERQEDAISALVAPRGEADLIVLSDGMGGHDAGDVASQIIVSAVLGQLLTAASWPGELRRNGTDHLRKAVAGANDRLRDHVRTAGLRAGMGGTVVTTLISDGHLRWISVGDSPLYLFRRDRLWRLNTNHSLAPQIDLLAAQGELDPDSARRHPDRGVLTSALTGGRIEQVDCPQDGVALHPDDIVLLASDGVHALDDTAIARLLARLRNRPPREIADRLLAAVKARGAEEQDNVTLAVIAVRLAGEQPAPARAAGLSGLARLRPLRWLSRPRPVGPA